LCACLAALVLLYVANEDGRTTESQHRHLLAGGTKVVNRMKRQADTSSPRAGGHPLRYRRPVPDTETIQPKRTRVAGKPVKKEEEEEEYEDDEGDDDEEVDYEGEEDEDEDYDEDDYDDEDEDADEDADEDDDYEEPDFTPLRFFDVDGDRLTFKIGRNGQLCEFVNGVCEVKTVRELHYDARTGVITDESGSFGVPSESRSIVVAELRRLAKLAYPKVRLHGFPDEPRSRKRRMRVPVMNHEMIEEAIASEQKRIENATHALEGMEQMLAKWKEQMAEEEGERSQSNLPAWQRIHLAASIKRRKKDIERLENDIDAMKKAREYMEETVLLFKSDLNETTSGPQLPPVPPCRSVPVLESASGGWEFNPLHTGSSRRTETPHSYVITIEAPGMDLSDVKVSVKDANLIVKGAVEQLLEGGSCIQTLDRTIPLPQNAEAARVSATLMNGKLTIELPKVNAIPKGEEKDVPIHVEPKEDSSKK